MSTGTSCAPASSFVDGFVIWKSDVAEMGEPSPMGTPTAGDDPELMIVTNAVAGWFTCTDRLDGRTAATSGGTVGGIGPQPATSVYSKTWLFWLLFVPACTQVPVWLIPIEKRGPEPRPMFSGDQF